MREWSVAPRTIIVKHRHWLHCAIHTKDNHRETQALASLCHTVTLARIPHFLFTSRECFWVFVKGTQSNVQLFLQTRSAATKDTEIAHSHGKLEHKPQSQVSMMWQLNRPNRNKTTFNVHSDQKDNTFTQEIKCELVHWTDRQSCV